MQQTALISTQIVHFKLHTKIYARITHCAKFFAKNKKMTNFTQFWGLNMTLLARNVT